MGVVPMGQMVKKGRMRKRRSRGCGRADDGDGGSVAVEAAKGKPFFWQRLRWARSNHFAHQFPD